MSGNITAIRSCIKKGSAFQMYSGVPARWSQEVNWVSVQVARAESSGFLYWSFLKWMLECQTSPTSSQILSGKVSAELAGGSKRKKSYVPASGITFQIYHIQLTSILLWIYYPHCRSSLNQKNRSWIRQKIVICWALRLSGWKYISGRIKISGSYKIEYCCSTIPTEKL